MCVANNFDTKCNQCNFVAMSSNVILWSYKSLWIRATKKRIRDMKEENNTHHKAGLDLSKKEEKRTQCVHSVTQHYIWARISNLPTRSSTLLMECRLYIQPASHHFSIVSVAGTEKKMSFIALELKKNVCLMDLCSDEFFVSQDHVSSNMLNLENWLLRCESADRCHHLFISTKSRIFFWTYN